MLKNIFKKLNLKLTSLVLISLLSLNNINLIYSMDANDGRDDNTLPALASFTDQSKSRITTNKTLLSLPPLIGSLDVDHNGYNSGPSSGAAHNKTFEKDTTMSSPSDTDFMKYIVLFRQYLRPGLLVVPEDCPIFTILRDFSIPDKSKAKKLKFFLERDVVGPNVVTAVDNRYQTPFGLARKLGYDKCAEVLRTFGADPGRLRDRLSERVGRLLADIADHERLIES